MTVGLALVVRALCWFIAVRHPERFFTDDAHGYTALAQDLRAGYLTPASPLFVTGLLRTPGYPVFLGALLSLFRGSLALVVAVQIGVSVFSLWLTCTLARRLLEDRSALAAGLVLALDPASALFSCVLQPEALFTTLVVAGVVLWQTAVDRSEWRPAAWAGGLLGVAALTRPIGLFLPFWLAPAAWLRADARQKARLALCFVLAALLPVGAWMAKNQVLIGDPVFTIVGDSSLLHYRAAGALAEDERIPLEQARERVWQRFWASVPPGASVAESSRRQRLLALQILAEHPWGTAKMMSNAVLRMAAGTGLTALSNLVGDPDPEGVSRPWQRAVQALQLLGLAVVYLAVARGAILLAGRPALLALALTLGVVLYFALVSAGPEANTRFRFPATPFLAILAGHGLTQPFRRVRALAHPAGAE